jgi:hypothetical protein|tara:strand:- start:16086 stop:16391 length:306 start_codon:yes stop_codon:yes gene_type:complete
MAKKEKKSKYDTVRIKQIIRQISGKFDEESQQNDLIPSAMINGSGDIWCWSPEKREFIKINRGIKIYIVDFEKDNKDRLMVYDGSNIFMIDEEEITEIGFN